MLRVASGEDLVSAIATATHAPTPATLASGTLAVALARLAAAGAAPAWACLAITLPSSDAALLEDVAASVGTLARHAGVEIVGGDTTGGPLALTVTAHGTLPAGTAIPPGAARAGDRIVAIAAAPRSGDSPSIAGPVLAGPALRGLAHACADTSDGARAAVAALLGPAGEGARLDSAPPEAAERPPRLYAALAPHAVDALDARLARAGMTLETLGAIEAAPGIRIATR